MAAIERIRRGEPITAKRLNEYGDSINEIKREIFSGPQQNDEDTAPPEVQAEASEEEGETVSSSNYIESSRLVSQIQVFDQDDVNYATIDRIEKITFTNGDGESITLTFNNPTG